MRQGQDEHAAGRAPGARAHALPVGELAASPLQRPRQPAAALAASPATRPPYADNDAELFAALADFEATYSQYAEFQERMEHYWCLRWLLQEGVTETPATVIRENSSASTRLPLIVRLADLRAAPADTPVRVAIGASTSSRRRSSAASPRCHPHKSFRLVAARLARADKRSFPSEGG